MLEIADALGESERTIYRDWRRSRAWLGRDLFEVTGEPGFNGG